MIVNKEFDNGKAFDWGRTSSDYGKYRDIYPQEFYDRILELGLCVKGQRVLDLGTGTGVLPRNLYRYGARFVGADISENQIAEAKRISESMGMDIEYIVSSAEDISFPDNTFDVVTACQCFMYFDKSVVLPGIARMLKPGGMLAILFMAWLPEESEIASRSEELVLKYNPSWTGGGMKRYALEDLEWAKDLYDVAHNVAFDINVTFTRETWNGRVRACRGIGASLDDAAIEAFDREHRRLLEETAPENFEILHYVTMLVLRVKK
jgi:SAM-dependent methyltransferase